MKIFLQATMYMALLLISGCSHEPSGRWEATQSVEVYATNDHPLKVSFIVEKGELCAISEETLIRKDQGYKQVSCAKGKGWIADSYFKKLSD